MKPDIAGQRFGKLVAVRADHRAGKNVKWLYQCDCGGTTIQFKHAAVVTGHCGCETPARLAARFRTHGMASTGMYKAWFAMKDRCQNPRNRAYPYYGGRGIKVCQRWLESFENFLADMGPRPRGSTIDRIDNNGNYEKSNCRWATRKDQQRNRRNNALVEFMGERRCASEWADLSGVPLSTILGRIARGWSTSDAILTPVRKKYRNGRTRKAG